jgi:hypothetical protein
MTRLILIPMVRSGLRLSMKKGNLISIMPGIKYKSVSSFTVIKVFLAFLELVKLLGQDPLRKMVSVSFRVKK